MADDFGVLGNRSMLSKDGNTVAEKGKKRPWLKVFETLPPQLLNAYGEAKFAKTADIVVWTDFNEPLKSGGMYMTEFCAKDPERRGIATNRWLHAMLLFCRYQKETAVQKHNESLLNIDKCKELYAEIDLILPSLEYCLAPKKAAQKSGAASLRSAAYASQEPGQQKDPTLLDQHAKTLYDWLDTTKVSRVRMLAHWHSAAGLSFVAACHHRAAQCFRYHGNKMHGDGSPEVSLTEFQEGIKVRHLLGTRGTEPPTADASACDYS